MSLNRRQPCRPCDQKVTITRADFKAYELAALKARNLTAQLTETRAQRDALRRELEDLRANTKP